MYQRPFTEPEQRAYDATARGAFEELQRAANATLDEFRREWGKTVLELRAAFRRGRAG